jgi:serine/threonine protein kinase/Tol biopolymer transport system component
MEIAAGTRLGPYEIISRIGAGGMGEVWRARDTRLDRAVAVKVLPESLAQNAELQARFEREAKTISQLHHPHICALFDVGSQDGREFLVMELLEGESLAERLARGPLPLELAVRYAIEIADALSKAHRHGIVHRDLKPGNVMITASGAKLLDFGLAKHSATASGIFTGTTAVLAATEQRPLTAEGTIVGTLQYMSPEQLEGLDADARTDVFAFGALLYEMVTGKRAFEGRTRTSLIAAIVDREPQPISTLQPGVPPPLERVVSVCLRKDPDERWQSAHDVRLELEAIAAGSQDVAMQRRGRWPSIAGWTAAAAIALAAGIGWFFHSRSAQPPVPYAFMIPPPENGSFEIGDAPTIVSSDGRQFLLCIRVNGTKSFVVRNVDSFDLQPTAIPAASYDPFWSPDGKQLGFFHDGKLKRVAVKGGSAQTLADTGDARGASWGTSDTIVFAPTLTGPLMAVPAGGGAPRAVTKLDASRKEIAHWRPYFLPDGEHFLYAARSADPDDNSVWVGSLRSFDRKRVLDVDTTAIYDAGHLLYVDNDDLYAQHFNARTLEKDGDPFLIAHQVSLNRQFGAATYSAGGTTLAYHVASATTNPPISTVDRRTKTRTELPNVTGSNIDLSKDDKRLTFQRMDPERHAPDIWTADVTRGTVARISFDPSPDYGPVWSPDGKSLVYCGMRKNGLAVIRQSSSGTGAEEIVFEAQAETAGKRGFAYVEVDDWSRDGRFLLAETLHGGERLDLSVIDLAAVDHQPRPLLSTRFIEESGRFSPDGHWIAYLSNESGKRQVYVQPFPPNGTKTQVSIDGGDSARWRSDGRELYFTNREGRLLACTVAVNGGELQVSAPQQILDGISADYVVSSDGNTFYVSASRTNDTAPVRVLLDWTGAAK